MSVYASLILELRNAITFGFALKGLRCASPYCSACCLGCFFSLDLKLSRNRLLSYRNVSSLRCNATCALQVVMLGQAFMQITRNFIARATVSSPDIQAMADRSAKRVAEEQVKKLSWQIRALQQKKRRLSAKERQAASFPNPPSSQRVVLVYRFAGQAADVTLDFVRGRGQPRCATVELTDEQERTVLSEVAQASVQVAASSCQILEAARAARYVVEHRLYSWLLEQNCNFGVAPSRAQLVRQALLLVPTELSADVRQALRTGLTSAARTQRKWLVRFRTRWGARLGVLKTEDYVSVEEARQKATWSYSSSIFVCGVCAADTC